MAEKMGEVYEAYDMEVQGTGRGRGAVILMTDKGVRQVSSLNGTDERLQQEKEFKDKIYEKGFCNIDRVVANREDELVTCDRYGNPFVCREYFQGRECNASSIRDLEKAVINLAWFHRAGRELYMEENTSYTKKTPGNDMYPLYWTTSKEGIFMRYSYEFKMMCVELYHSGSYPDIPEGLNPNTLKRHIREWSRLVDLHGPEVLKHKVFNKVWTPEEKLELISKVIAGTPRTKVAIEAGINAGLLYQWVHKYKLQGYNGLVESKKGRPTKEPRMKKSTNPLPLTESEREELIRLRTENEYIKAENEVIKKRIALRQEKWVAQLKAKKQQSSKNSEKKDIN